MYQHAPGPTLYQGKYEAPKGSPAVVKETGALPGGLEAESKSLNQRFHDIKAGYMKQVNDVSDGDAKGKSLAKKPNAEEAKKIADDAMASYTKMPGILLEISAFQKKANEALAKLA
jgi:hypothetical protein